MTLLDATNAIQTLPITGFERVEFFFRTPGTDKGFDFSVKTGHPMFVYSLKNRSGTGPRAQIYTLKFISQEAIRNHQTRVSKAFTGNIDQMVVDICANYWKTKKDILVEDTKSNHKFVMPRIKPSKAIERTLDHYIMRTVDFYSMKTVMDLTLNRMKDCFVRKMVHLDQSKHTTHQRLRT
jgi:hypothetical protein